MEYRELLKQPQLSTNIYHTQRDIPTKYKRIICESWIYALLGGNTNECPIYS